ncbi:O-antigen ligase family protein [Fonticella tunisiensis]|uniref:O-antigen ligase-like membrane protein n=1 Tax=Fonticella tunisiensis TaxID=1096341 RepID=A0A4R7K9P8_9CLOT|nr:O-antigen ligase family protein [Fonticella tunisiensis]TDT50829.1 O-antigen ligase-like membrane protein [Fonticella tunisiensis]
MKKLSSINHKIIDALLIVALLFSSVTGWYTLDYIGMNLFWGVFILLSMVIFCLIIARCGFKAVIDGLFRSKFNFVVAAYLLWTAFTYLINGGGKSTLLYIFKMWFIVGIYLLMLRIYLASLEEESRGQLVYKICKYVFLLGIFHSVIGLNQFITLNNTILGVTISDWPAYNPASMYGNVNGHGTYLFLSIIAGIYYLILRDKKNGKGFIIFGLVLQAYMLYLTVARTSIVSAAVYVFLNLVAFIIFNTKQFKLLFNKRTLAAILISNLVMMGIIMLPGYRNELNLPGNNKSTRSAADMLAEKNEKGVNQRQFIWLAVIRDYKRYVLVGDGLQYNIVNKIDVEKVISSRSKGAERISYHNTLFRYFASNGLAGVIIFIAVFSYVPLTLLIKMFRNRKLNMKYFNIITLFTSIFLYMQMEEVYLGEIGFIQLVTLITIAYGSQYLYRNID